MIKRSKLINWIILFSREGEGEEEEEEGKCLRKALIINFYIKLKCFNSSQSQEQVTFKLSCLLSTLFHFCIKLLDKLRHRKNVNKKDLNRWFLYSSWKEHKLQWILEYQEKIMQSFQAISSPLTILFRVVNSRIKLLEVKGSGNTETILLHHSRIWRKSCPKTGT